MAYKQWTFISHNSGSWEVPYQGSGRFIIWWGFASWIIENCLVVSPPHGGRSKWASGISFIRALIPFMRAPQSWLNHLSRHHLLIHWGLESQHVNLERWTQSKHLVFCIYSPVFHFLCSSFLPLYLSCLLV